MHSAEARSSLSPNRTPPAARLHLHTRHALCFILSKSASLVLEVQLLHWHGAHVMAITYSVMLTEDWVCIL